MPGQIISDVGIAVMCDIARLSGADLAPAHKAELDLLVSDGLVTEIKPAHGDAPAYRLTSKGQQVLDARGVGVNEA
jgi:hypothetical protein